ncbi:MAG: BatA domain-containing protein [Bacteroidales bacterium]|nr:BatA domain-containing protein [Bacteroidales bacterium]
MEFANPLFLFGLAAIAIPIVIHLFNFRKFKKVYFTNVKFIEELKQQTRQQSQLRHLLILLMRILAVSALVLAFSQPFIPVKENTSDRSSVNAISIYVDNSFSMEAQSNEGRLLDQALNKAREIAFAFNNSDEFQLLTNDFEGRHQRFVNREDFLELLNDVELSSLSRKLSEVYKRQADFLHEAKGNRTACMVSDFQKNTSDFGQILQDSTIKVYVIPATGEKTGNLYIDSVWFEEPVYRVDQLATLHLNIVNDSEEDFEKIPVKLSINKEQRAIASFDIQAGAEAEILLPYSNNAQGLQYGELSIIDYPVTYDDNFYFTYEVLNEIPVLAINSGDENVYFNSLFKNDSLIDFQNADVNRLDYTTFNQHNLILLNGLNFISSGLSQELKRFAQGGGNIVVFPGEVADASSWREFFLNMETPFSYVKDTFQTRISSMNLQSTLYDDVFESLPENLDLPVVFKHYTINRQVKSMTEVLLEMQNGDIFLASVPAGKGKLYIFPVPLNPEWSNFPKHAIFVPTLYKIALLSKPFTKLYYTTGKEDAVLVKSENTTGENVIKIKSIAKEFEIIPEVRSAGSLISIFTGSQIKDAGLYNVNANDALITAVAFNFDRAESKLESYAKNEIEGQIADAGLTTFSVLSDAQNKSLSAVIAEINSGKKLWKLFLTLALVFLLGEVVLLRFWK